jgi:murein DD-endopeptidase MepM/ murein hydrolase activator NlpD
MSPFPRGLSQVLTAAAALAVLGGVWFGTRAERPPSRVGVPEAPARELASRHGETEPSTPDAGAGPGPENPRLEELLMPIAGLLPEQLRDNFEETRGGTRRHEAIDILAPRNTPVLAVTAGTVAKLFQSDRGGLTIYQFDLEQRFAYYYAHLERYAGGLEEGDPVARGEVIGYVGTSGNAPRDTPHLHFAIYRLGPERNWWEGEALNPFPLLRGGD